MRRWLKAVWLWVRIGTVQQFIRFGTAGCADILACPQGKPPVWIELKSAKGRQRPEQKSFQLAVEGAGHVYQVCRSLEEVQEVLR